MLYITTLFLVLSCHAVEPPAITFLSKGLPIPEPSVSEKGQPDALTTFEPQENKMRSFRGFPILPLLKTIYGEKLTTVDTISFYCQDGYRADIPLKDFEKQKALLAYQMADQTPFSLAIGKNTLDLAPYYLVWDHPNKDSLKNKIYRWPYAITQIDAIESKSAYAPLETNLKELQEGKKYFITYCFSCHSLNGAGGRRGPPLNPFFLTQNEKFLLGYILNPKKINPQAQMSGLSQDLKNRTAVAKKIISYGKNIAK